MPARASRPSSRNARPTGRGVRHERGIMILRVCRGAALMAALLMGPVSAGAQPAELPATVVTLTGKVELYKKGDTKWTTAELRDELREGDGLRTSPAVRATLRTGGGQSIRLAALTQVFIVPSAGTGVAPQPVSVRLDRGWLWVAVRDGGVGFRLNRDGSAIVRTYHGLAVVRSSSPAGTWERSLPELQEVLVPAAGPPAENRKITREEGEGLWVLWNEEQDYVAYGGKAPLR